MNVNFTWKRMCIFKVHYEIKSLKKTFGVRCITLQKKIKVYYLLTDLQISLIKNIIES